MKRQVKVVLVFFMILLAGAGWAQKAGNIDVQIDLIPFALGGYAGEVGFSIDKHRLYATAVSYKVPAFLKEDKNFDEKRDLIIGIGYQYFLTQKLKGLYFGGSILYTWATFTNPTTGNSEQLPNYRISSSCL